MAVPVFPCALPCRMLREQWSMEPRDPNRRTEMDDGTMAVRRKLHRIPVEIGVGWEMDRRQVGVFKAWWKTDLDGGVLWFDGPVFDGVCAGSARLRFVDGDPPWRITQPQNGRFLVVAKVEIKDLDVWDADEREAAEIDILYPTGASGLEDDLQSAIEELSF